MAVGVATMAAGLRTAEVPDAPLPKRPFSHLVVGPVPTAERSAATDTARAAGPNRLLIPELGIDAPVVPERAEGGALVIPGNPGTLGRWVGSAAITAAAGTTLIAGHVSMDGEPGALSSLSRVAPGAVVVTTDPVGRPTLWRVVDLQSRSKDELPAFPATGTRRLAIVTCGGPLQQIGSSRSYRDNVIAYAVPAPAPASAGSDSLESGT